MTDISDQLPLAFIDIDGVVADVRHRLFHIERRPKDWDGFFEAAIDDPPHDEGLAIVDQLANDHEIVFLTGRPHRTEPDTREWLERHGLGDHRLVMRPEGDRRPAPIVKAELLAELGRGRVVSVVVDDDASVVAALRHAGYNVFHADWEARSPDEERARFDAQDIDGRT